MGDSVDEDITIDSIFADLSEPDVQGLIRLPFRVGVWISSSDSTGGAESEAQELKTLETIVATYAEEYLKSEFVQKLLERTFAARADWPLWSRDVEQVPQECRHLMSQLETLLPVRELSAFRENLVDIAVAVAMAYREEGESDTQDRNTGGFLRALLKALGLSSASVPVNISRAERKALRQLAMALNVPDPVRAMSG